MDKGWIQQIGTPKEIYDHPANVFVANFIGSPAMNIVEATLSNGVVDFGEAGKLELPAEYYSQYVEAIKNKIKDIEEFAKNGLEKEYEKELLVKRETIALQLKNGKYKAQRVNGQLVNPLTGLVLDEEETQVCQELFNKQLEEKLALKVLYEEMLDSGVYKIKFGIRPEDIFIKDGNITKEAKPSTTLATSVKITELLGNEFFVHVDILNKDFIFKTGTNNEFEENDKVDILFDLNKIHIFDTLDNKVIF
jgi:ABC-type sugar transport system ATPase subunit